MRKTQTTRKWVKNRCNYITRRARLTDGFRRRTSTPVARLPLPRPREGGCSGRQRHVHGREGDNTERRATDRGRRLDAPRRRRRKRTNGRPGSKPTRQTRNQKRMGGRRRESVKRDRGELKRSKSNRRWTGKRAGSRNIGRVKLQGKRVKRKTVREKRGDFRRDRRIIPRRRK